jgi:hypothetical protein
MEVSTLLPNNRKYFSTIAVFWTTGGGPARRFGIADWTFVIAHGSLARRSSPGAIEGGNH